VYSTVFVAGMFTAGRFANSPRFRAMTYDMLDAAVVNSPTPRSSRWRSGASGRTARTTSRSRKIGVPAYALAGLMGVSRIHQDKHWLSDVVAGATLTVAPIVARHASGLQMMATF
jgi:membrane-associated phospholipid phosphatase